MLTMNKFNEGRFNKGDWVWFLNWGIIEPQGVLSGVVVHVCDIYALCYILPLGEVEPLHVEWEWVCGQEEEALELFREYWIG